MEWQRDKAAKRMQRKQHPEKESPEGKEEPETGLTPAEPSQVGE